MLPSPARTKSAKVAPKNNFSARYFWTSVGYALRTPISFVVQQILRKNKLSYSPEINPYVCDSRQLAKTHQLPYTVSTSVSIVPLEEVFVGNMPKRQQ